MRHSASLVDKGFLVCGDSELEHGDTIQLDDGRIFLYLDDGSTVTIVGVQTETSD